MYTPRQILPRQGHRDFLFHESPHVSLRLHWGFYVARPRTHAVGLRCRFSTPRPPRLSAPQCHANTKPTTALCHGGIPGSEFGTREKVEKRCANAETDRAPSRRNRSESRGQKGWLVEICTGSTPATRGSVKKRIKRRTCSKKKTLSLNELIKSSNTHGDFAMGLFLVLCCIFSC